MPGNRPPLKDLEDAIVAVAEKSSKFLDSDDHGVILYSVPGKLLETLIAEANIAFREPEQEQIEL